MGSLSSKFLELAKNAKDIYDQELFGEPSERVTITWGKNKIGFDKSVSVSIEDSLEKVIAVFRADARGELKEIDLGEEEKDMPTMHIDDIGNPEKEAEFKKASEKFDRDWERKRNERNNKTLPDHLVGYRMKK